MRVEEEHLILLTAGVRIPLRELPLLGKCFSSSLGVGESDRAGMSPEARDPEGRVKLKGTRQSKQFVCSLEERSRRKES